MVPVEEEIFYYYWFHWSIVTLQRCVHVYYTAKWISYTCSCISSFLDFLAIYITTEHWEEFPVLHSRSLLVMCFMYSSMSMWILMSQFITPHFFPLVTISFFSTLYVCSVNKFICTIFFLDSTCKWYHMIFVILCLTYFTQSDNF